MSATFHTLGQLDVAGKRLLIRQDLNVPIDAGQVTNTARIDASLPTLKRSLERGAAVLVCSHLGRPVEGQPDAGASLQPVADTLAAALDRPVPLVSDYLNGVVIEPGEIKLLENVRFNAGEKANDAQLAKRLAALCDIFVMDAFGTAHRAQASTHGVASYAPMACAGPLLAAELEALGRCLDQPERPLVAVVGGAKVSTKLAVLDSLLDQVDTLIVGGGIANTFLAASGYAVGNSLFESDQIERAKAMLTSGKIPLPKDVVTALAFAADAPATVAPVDQIAHDQMVLDIGPKTRADYAALIAQAKTVVLNGPVGVFEFAAFGAGTQAVLQAVADSAAFSIAGGGDTLAAIDKYDLRDGISYRSTGGGAFLEFLEGKTLPAVAVLQQRFDD